MKAALAGTFVLFATLSFLSPAASAAAPDWVMKGSTPDKDVLFAVGSGPTREAAMLNALVDLVKFKKLASGVREEQNVSAVIQEEVKGSFGPVSIKSRAKDYERKARDERIYEQSVEASFKKGKESVLVKLTLDSAETPKTNSLKTALELDYQGLVFGDLFEELARQGIGVQSYVDEADFTHYAGLKLPLSKAKPLPAAPYDSRPDPDWASASGRVKDGALVVHGKGASRAEALAEALAELADMKKAYLLGSLTKSGMSVFSERLKEARLQPEQFGPISVLHTGESFNAGQTIRPEDPNDEDQRLSAVQDEIMLRLKKAHMLRDRTEISLKTRKGSLTLVTTDRSVSGSESMEPIEDKTSVETKAEGLTLDDLFDELRLQGVAQRTCLDPNSAALSIGLELQVSPAWPKPSQP
jgi:hypothetical protein